MVTAEIAVAVEKAVHAALRELAQSAWDKHGVCVQSVRFSWFDASTLAEPRLIVSEVEAEMSTKT